MTSPMPQGSPESDLIPSTLGSLTIDHLEKTIGVYFIGYMFSMVLYGFTFFQAYMYYSRYPKDTWGTKTFVALIVGIDTAVSSLLSQTLYYYLVTLFPFTRGVELATTPYCAQLELSVISVFLAQLFYAWSIWTNSKNALTSGATALLATASFVLGTIMTVQLIQNPEFAHMEVNPNKAIAAISHGLAAASAILSFVSLSIGPVPKGFKPFKSVFDNLVGYSISYGGCAVIVQLAFTFVFVGAPSRHYWIPFHVVSTKLFVIGAITYLNTRESLEQRAQHKEDWSTGSGTRTFGNSGAIGTGGSVPHGGMDYGNVKPIVISVDHSTEREGDSEYRMKRAYDEPYQG